MIGRLVRFEDLSANEMFAWDAIRRSDPMYDSPFFHPKFAEIVASVRHDLRIIIVEEAGQVKCIWPVHPAKDRFARPIASPFSDYHGPLMAKDFDADARTVLELVGLWGAAFAGVQDPKLQFLSSTYSRDGAYIIDVSDGADAYFEWQRENFPKHAKKMRRLARKAEREVGELTFTFDDRDETALDQVFTWKCAQYDETGRHDVLGPDWSRQMLRRIFHSQTPDCRGILHTLRHDGELVAAEFNFLGDDVVHGWFPAYDEAFSALSPGMLLQDLIIRGASERGYSKLDLGVGAGHYKKYYSTYQVILVEGTVWAPGAVPQARKLLEDTWRAIEAAPLGKPATLAGKLRRRYDLIQAVEPTARGRINGIVRALRPKSTDVKRAPVTD